MDLRAISTRKRTKTPALNAACSSVDSASDLARAEAGKTQPGKEFSELTTAD